MVTKEGLETIHLLLRKSATKNTAVSCHWIRNKHTSELMWIVGNNNKFNKQGYIPVNYTETNVLNKYKENDWKYLQATQSLTAISALFHDWGKANDYFQSKLKTGSKEMDPLRHEFVSLMLLGGFINIEPKTWKERLIDWDWSEAEIIDAASKFDMENFSEFPLDAQIVAWLILSHHKMPINKSFGKGESLNSIEEFFYIVDKNWGYANKDKEEKDALNFSHGILKSSTIWKKKAQKWAKKLLLNKDTINEAAQNGALRHILHFSRLSLMLADHQYSSMPADELWKSETKLYANTDPKTKRPKQKLDEHLCKVCDTALSISYRLPIIESEAPYTENTKALRKLSPKKFAWQDKAAAKIKTFQKSENRGFFAVNMASTGMGKTIANAKIMKAVSPNGDSLRYILALGLRTLTLQTGDEYRKRLGLSNKDMATVIGSNAISKLHGKSERIKQSGSESAEDLMTENVFFEYADSELFSTVLTKEKYKKLLQAPVLVTTVDHIIGAVNVTKGGKWILPSLRMLNSDIVIDEIDDFTDSDLIAIGRLIFFAGMNGRKVMVSSATIPPDMAEGFFHAYKEGWEIFAASKENVKKNVDVFWCDEFKSLYETIESNAKNAENEYAKLHKKFIDYRTKKLAESAPKRKGCISNANIENEKEKNTRTEKYFYHIVEQIKKMHEVNGFEIDGKKISIGVVRMANISPCVAFGKYLAEYEDKDVDVKFMIYHSQQTLIMRYEQEKYLDKILNRKNEKDFLKNVEEDPFISGHLHDSNKKNVVFVVVATPVEEVGRDHDFDWAVIEPSSFRSIIQMAGRVKRHRDFEAKEPNISILKYNFKAFMDGDRENRRYFVKPGFEVIENCSLFSHDMAKITDENYLMHGIDAIPRITKRNVLEPSKRLDDLEHCAVMEWLTKYESAHADKLEGFLRGSWFLTAMPVHFNPFRKGSVSIKCFRIYDEEKEKIYFAELDENNEPIDRGDILGISEVDEKKSKNYWIKRDYAETIEKYKEEFNMSAKEFTKVFGELSWTSYGDEQKLLYSDQFGLYQPI